MVKKIKDKNAPKRPPSSFLLFANHTRDTNEAIKNKAIKEQAQEIGQLWQELDEEARKPFLEQAAKLKEEYVEKKDAYEKSEEYREFQRVLKAGPKEMKKRRGPIKMSGYRLFILENKEHPTQPTADDETAGMNHMARIGHLWGKLSQEERDQYNERAKAMPKLAKEDGIEEDVVNEE